MFSNQTTIFGILCGAAFAGTASAANYTLLRTFQGAPDGAGPTSSLAVSGTKLYGTTYTGGAANYGTIFSVNPKTGAVKVIYSFLGGTDGAGPLAGLTPAGDILYGVTSYGGASGNGTVFSLNLKTGAEQVVHSFRGGKGGAHPQGSLLKIGNVLFGTTTNGGAAGYGTVFKLDTKTGRESTVYAFPGGSGGAYPFASLLDLGGTLFGTTSGGGTASCAPYGCGTVFSIDSKTGSEKLVYAFQGATDGAVPYAGLINVGGLFYGTTTDGGGGAVCSRGCGTVYWLNPATGAEQVVYAFQNSGDGAAPLDSLVNTGGLLYGTTQGGGANRFGSVFALNPAASTITTLYSFAGAADGSAPYGGLASAGGTLYGTTQVGGAANDGTVFGITP